MTSVVFMLGQGLQQIFSGTGSEKETPLMRMFRVEYAKDYRWLRRNRVPITDDFVMQYLDGRSTDT